MTSFIKEYFEMAEIMSFYNYLKVRFAIKFKYTSEVKAWLKLLSTDIFLRTAFPTDYQVLKYVFKDVYHVPFKTLPAHPVIFDLGANVGFTCLHYAILFPGARITGFELADTNYRYAVRNTKAYLDIKIENKGIGYKSGSFFYEPNAQSDAFQINESRSVTSKEGVVISMQEAVINSHMEKIDFLKWILRELKLNYLKKVICHGWEKSNE